MLRDDYPTSVPVTPGLAAIASEDSLSQQPLTWSTNISEAPDGKSTCQALDQVLGEKMTEIDVVPALVAPTVYRRLQTLNKSMRG